MKAMVVSLLGILAFVPSCEKTAPDAVAQSEVVEPAKDEPTNNEFEEKPLTEEQNQLLRDVTYAAAVAYRARYSAEKRPESNVRLVDYTRAAAQMDAAILAARNAGIDDLYIAGSESEGNTTAMQDIDKRESERAAEEAEDSE